MSSNLLKNKIALVTGSGRGIGKAVAIAYAQEGAKLILVARTDAQLQETVAEIAATGGVAMAITADLTDAGQVTQMADQIKGSADQIDILFNNAGGGIEKEHVVDSDPKLWIKDVNVNLISAYLVTQAILPHMMEGGGKIINMGSGMGHSPGAGNSAYHVGKAGMWMLTRCLADEVWEKGITVNELIPGPVATDLTAGRMAVGGPPPFAPSEYVKSPEDVIPLALWLATQPSHGPTAQSFSLTRRSI
ncbi:MAG: SDR family oxidoreductase [Candidatus Latescibacterota bacterium]|nr:SDR family oxidoreductase [Candidatus Latescibacterota bacterium]